jgi:hypothetical protein
MAVASSVAPNAVRDVNARFFGGEHYIGRLLCSDPRMEQVWKTLMKEGDAREKTSPKEFKDRLDSLRDIYRMEKWDTPTDGVLLPDQACASFFLATSIIIGVGNHAIKESNIQKELTRCQDAATLCREALCFPHRAANDPDLAAALSLSAAYFEEWAKILKNSNMNSPYLVERATGGSDDIRAQVRHVATVTREMFGSFMYRTVATAASVATGSAISWKQVANWCDDDLTLLSQ